jgi:hypothetical protein
MSIAQAITQVEDFFMQACPLCGTKHRIMIHGNYIEGDVYKKYPDMGYSFCNCHNVFYTKWENIVDPDGWNGSMEPIVELKSDFYEMLPGQEMNITMLDPYFVNWKNPYNMWHWNCRKVFMLWDMHSFVDVCKEIGFEVVSFERDMDVESKTPQRFHVKVRKP